MRFSNKDKSDDLMGNLMVKTAGNFFPSEKQLCEKAIENFEKAVRRSPANENRQQDLWAAPRCLRWSETGVLNARTEERTSRINFLCTGIKSGAFYYIEEYVVDHHK